MTLLRELKEALQPNGLLLTVAVAAGRSVIDAAYDIPGIASYVDLANVMTYDFHGTWETYTHHQSGLYAYSADAGDNIYLNVVGGAGSATPRPIQHGLHSEIHKYFMYKTSPSELKPLYLVSNISSVKNY